MVSGTTVGILISAGAVVITLVGVSYRTGRKLSSFEGTVKRGFADLSEATEDNNDELRTIAEKLTRIEAYASQQGNLESDGGTVVGMDQAPSDGERQVGDRTLAFGVDRRTYVTEVGVSSADDTELLFPTGGSEERSIASEIESALEDATGMTVDVDARDDYLSVIVPTTDEETVTATVKALVENLPALLVVPGEDAEDTTNEEAETDDDSMSGMGGMGSAMGDLGTEESEDDDSTGGMGGMGGMGDLGIEEPEDDDSTPFIERDQDDE